MKYAISFFIILLASAIGFAGEAKIPADVLLQSFQTVERIGQQSDLEQEIAALEAQLSTATAEEFANLKLQLNDLYAQRPQNQFINRYSLDQGADNCPGTQIPSVISYSDTGTTTGLANNFTECGPNTAADVIYRYTPPQTMLFALTLCNGSSYDTRIEVRTSGACPGTSQVACNDDYCDLQSQVIVELTAGTNYYIIVDGFSSSSGHYELTLTGFPNCVDCQGSDLMEPAENVSDTSFYRTDPTGGCNSEPHLYGSISCGQTVCGRGFFYLTQQGNLYRDTDWYRFQLASAETLFAEVSTEFEASVYLMDLSNCPADLLANVIVPACSTGRVQTSACVGPGSFGLFVAPVFGGGVPRGIELGYRATLSCSPCVACVTDQAISAPGQWIGRTCGADDNCGLRSAEDRIYEVTIPHESDWTISTCDSATEFDTFLYLTTDCCGGSIIASNDDFCDGGPGLASTIRCVHLTAGTYYIAVEGFSTSSCGNFKLMISDCSTPVDPQPHSGIAGEFQLAQNFPNPFNPTTTIAFDVPRAGLVNLTVYNLLGEAVTVLANESLSAGSYSVDFDASALPSGVYLYRLQAEGVDLARKMVLMK